MDVWFLDGLFIDMEDDEMKPTVFVLLVPILLLSGCSIVHSDCSLQLENGNETVMETAVQVTESLEDEVTETIVSRSQEIIDSAWDNRLSYYGSGINSIPNIVIEESDVEGYVYIVNIDDDLYPNLTDSVRQTQQDYIEILNCEPDYIIRNYTHEIHRCDNRVLSISNWLFMSDGAENGMRISEVTYNTWDYNGRELYLTDIVCDYQCFITNIHSLIMDSLYESGVTDAEMQYDELLHYSSPNDIDFYLTDDSLMLVLNNDNLINTSNNTDQEVIRIEIKYKEYADLFNPEYLPSPGLMLSSQDVDIVNVIIDSFSHDEIYDSPAAMTFYIQNNDGTNYYLVAYESSFVMETRAAGDNGDGIPRYLVVLYEADTGEEVGSVQVEDIDVLGRDTMNLNGVFEFVTSILE